MFTHPPILESIGQRFPLQTSIIGLLLLHHQMGMSWWLEEMEVFGFVKSLHLHN